MRSCVKPVVTELEHLEHEIVELASHIHAATCRWLMLIAEFDRREGWLSWGCKSCAHWVAWRCAVTPVAAREHVRVARALDGLPLIRDAFGRGELSYSKVRALTRVAGVQRERELLEMARHATAAQLERILGAYRRVARSEAAAPGGGPERWLRWVKAEDGSLLLSARLPAEAGAVVLAALEAAMGAPTQAPPPASAEATAGTDASRAEGAPSWGERCADALVATAEAALASDAATRSGDRHQVVVHIDLDAIGASAEASGAVLEDGTALFAATARRLGCDGAVVALVERAGQPLSVGRKTRAIPPALRRALRSRDRGCRFPGCTTIRHVDAHHIEHWADGGETRIENLVELCRQHHRLLHEGGFRLTRGADGFEFLRPDGRRVREQPSVPRGSTTQLLWLNEVRSGPIEPLACVPRGGGERYDLGLAVDAVLSYAPPLMAPGV